MTSTPVVPTQSELDSRISAFADALNVKEPLVRKALSEVVDIDRPDQALSIFDDEDILTFGDLAKHFVQPGLCKVTTLRFAMKHLRGQTELKKPNGSDGMSELAEAVSSMAKSNRPIENWSDRELLEQYDEGNVKVCKELSDRAHARHCIVYTSSTEETVDLDSSGQMLKLAKKQTTPDKWRVDGQLRPVRRPGTFMARMLQESPFYRRVALVAGYCSQSDTDWNGIDHKTRVLVRLHLDKVETAALSKREMKRICKEAHDLSSKDFSNEYSEAQMYYDELDAQDNLPKLKITTNDAQTRPSGGTDNGFGRTT